MGDYTKLIVNCSVKKMTDEEAKDFENEVLERLGGLRSSAYHCAGELCVVQNDWQHRTELTIVNQHKYGGGIEGFLSWLEPKVIDGIGMNSLFAIVMDEYCVTPKLYYKETV